MDDFRKKNTDEVTVLNFFDEMEVAPVALQLEINDTTQITEQIFKEIGAPRNYGKTAEEIVKEMLDAEAKRVLCYFDGQEEQELFYAKERERIDAEEAERRAKKAADLVSLD